MSDPAQAALITVCGMVGVAGLTGFFQVLVTRFVIRSEQAKLSQQLTAEQDRIIKQLQEESRFRRWEAKYNRLANVLGDFIAATDPDRPHDIDAWLPLLHKIQLLLLYDKGPEQELNGALNNLGYALQGITPADKSTLYALQSEVIERAKALLASYHHSS